MTNLCRVKIKLILKYMIYGNLTYSLYWILVSGFRFRQPVENFNNKFFSHYSPENIFCFFVCSKLYIYIYCILLTNLPYIIITWSLVLWLFFTLLHLKCDKWKKWCHVILFNVKMLFSPIHKIYCSFYKV